MRDATWRDQLRSLSGQALFRLNSLLGVPTVTMIEFVINRKLVLQTHTESDPIKFEAPDRQSAPLQDVASRIPIEDVRTAFLRAAGKCLDRRAK